jgi:hypothetical protein
LGIKTSYIFLNFVDMLQSADVEGVIKAQPESKLVRNA